MKKQAGLGSYDLLDTGLCMNNMCRALRVIMYRMWRCIPCIVVLSDVVYEDEGEGEGEGEYESRDSVLDSTPDIAAKKSESIDKKKKKKKKKKWV